MIIKTRVCPGRLLTPAEIDATEIKTSEAVAAGTHDGQVLRVNELDPVTRTATRVWSTLEAANDWVAFMNSFTPAPVSAEVIEE
jgi:hypothetical protein